MSLAKRLNQMEARIRALEEGQALHAQVIEAAVEEAEEVDQPQLTLDGEEHGGERDQDQPL
jgi:hypothetical protein